MTSISICCLTSEETTKHDGELGRLALNGLLKYSHRGRRPNVREEGCDRLEFSGTKSQFSPRKTPRQKSWQCQPPRPNNPA